MSLALFGKKKNDGREIEINTLKCKQAYITFDRPIAEFTPSELSGRKVVEAELFGDTNKPIIITNNRRSTIREDDLVVTINNGPLYYFEKTQLVRTSDHVQLKDGESVKTRRTTHSTQGRHRSRGHGDGIDHAAPPPRPGFLATSKPKNESISGVKRIVLKEAVNMDLYVAHGAPFPNNENGDRSRKRDKTPLAVETLPNPAARSASRRRADSCTSCSRTTIWHASTCPPTTPIIPAARRTSPSRASTRTASQDMLVCKHLELRLSAERRKAGRQRRSGRQRLEAGSIRRRGA